MWVSGCAGNSAVWAPSGGRWLRSFPVAGRGGGSAAGKNARSRGGPGVGGEATGKERRPALEMLWGAVSSEQ